MQNVNRRFRLDQPATYRVEVEGKLGERCASWFDDMAIAVESSDDGSSVTILTGVVGDQAALHGLLGRVRDLGLLLLSVQRIEDQRSET